MCRLDQPTPRTDVPLASDTPSPGRPAFTARRLTPTTFLITEFDDIYYEHPFIYVKIVPAARTLLLLDTGCGGATRTPDASFTRLRDFIECAPVADNGGRALNEGGELAYVVVLSHCHFDHILGVEQFAGDSLIIASGNDPAFIAPDVLPEHSICADLEIRTPSYTPTLLPHRAPIVSAYGVPLGVELLHTPGHTPDELALWDEEEGMLYVGDTLYEHEPIIFPKEGSIIDWLGTIDSLIQLVEGSKRVSAVGIGCGHRTAGGGAQEVLLSTKAFMLDVLAGREEVKSRLERRGEVNVKYAQSGGRYSLICPERLVEEARKATNCEVGV
ncbi:uncharacterized protein TRAVEDRAFT_126407 [Trametes versicolor FP-101664 SS1]|uniref:uncharacterized protein n=1 Tax=Trametes versicolor (strain FP-101664) TaxID=717944 RepID=UPI0004622C7F|nr:uncharacterized protein TRAVEDRAFT_126407 [Trametes versicolor FP-101664 SS1]EIW57308.1 hypothetical protein TRAVEDRAFT_126407 [Trametes versicolor FP-101664 SS1]